MNYYLLILPIIFFTSPSVGMRIADCLNPKDSNTSSNNREALDKDVVHAVQPEDTIPIDSIPIEESALLYKGNIEEIALQARALAALLQEKYNLLLPNPARPQTESSSNSRKRKINLSPSQQHECSTCGIKCPTHDSLQNHYNRHHGRGNEIITCPDCKRTMKQRNLAEHKSSYHGTGNQIITCLDCGREMKQRSLTEHRNSHHAHPTVIKEQCPLCGKELTTKYITHHMKRACPQRVSAPDSPI